MSSSDNNKKRKKKMAVLTAKCNRTFVVSPQKSKEFLEIAKKNNNEEILSKITKKIKKNDDKA